MGVFNNAIPKYTGNLYNEIVVSPAEPVVPVDDIFDPILNKAVKDRLRDRWGNPIAATFGGYTELINNALLGNRNQGGTMLPGLGILSSFGRSMDKAGDFIIGGVTEGVKGLTGQGIESPLYNIFVEDEDYSGQRLLAAAANSMSKMAGAEVTEDDFRGLWSVPSLGLELATDPSIFGGALTKIAKGTGAVADMGRLLQNYDDLMARAAIDVTAPGVRPLAKKVGAHASSLLSNHRAESALKDAILEIDNTAKVLKYQYDGGFIDYDTYSKSMDNVSKHLTKLHEQALKDATDVNLSKIKADADTAQGVVEDDEFTKLAKKIDQYNSEAKLQNSSFNVGKNIGEAVDAQNTATSLWIDHLDRTIPVPEIKNVDYVSNYNSDPEQMLIDLGIKQNPDLFPKNNYGRAPEAFNSEYHDKLLTEILPQDFIHKYNINTRQDLINFVKSDLNDEQVSDFNNVFKERNLTTKKGGVKVSQSKSKLHPKTQLMVYNEQQDVLSRIVNEAVKLGIVDAKTISEDTLDEIFDKIHYYTKQYKSSDISPKFNQYAVLENYRFNKEYLKSKILNIVKDIPSDDVAKAKFETDESYTERLAFIVDTKIKDFKKTHSRLKNNNPKYIEDIKQLMSEKIVEGSDVTYGKLADEILKDEAVGKIPYTKYRKRFEHLTSRKPVKPSDAIKEFNIIEELVGDYARLDFNLPERTPTLFKDMYSSEAINNLKLRRLPKIVKKKNKYDKLMEFIKDEVVRYKSNIDSRLSGKIFTGTDDELRLLGKSITDVRENVLKTSKYSDFYKVDAEVAELTGNIGFSKAINDALSRKEFETPMDIYNFMHETIDTPMGKVSLADLGFEVTHIPKEMLETLKKQMGTEDIKKWFNDYKYVQTNPSFQFLNRLRPNLGEISEENYTKYIDDLRRGSDVLFETPAVRLNFKDPETKDALALLKSHSIYVDYTDPKSVLKALNNITKEDEFASVKKYLSREKPSPLDNTVVKIYNPDVPFIKKVSEADTDRIALDLQDTLSNDDVVEAIEGKLKLYEEADLAEKVRILNEVCPDETPITIADLKAYLDSDGGKNPIVRYVEENNPRQIRLFELLSNEFRLSLKSKQDRNAIMELPHLKQLLDDAEHLEEVLAKDSTGTARIYSLIDKQRGSVVRGTDFLTDLVQADGRKIIAYHRTRDAALAKATKQAISYNAKIINNAITKAGGKPIIEVIDNLSVTHNVGYRMVGDQKSWALLKKIAPDLKLKDVVFEPPVKLTAEELNYLNTTGKPVIDILNRTQKEASVLYKKMGFDYNDPDYFKHTFKNTKGYQESVGTLFYEGLDIKTSEQLADMVRNLDYLGDMRGVYGAIPNARVFEGNISRYNGMFSTKLDTIVKGTFTKGIFANEKFQTTVSVFENNDFKLNTYCKNIDDVKNILNSEANVRNLTIASPRYTEDGVFEGFTKYDNFSDTSLEKALEQGDAVFVPTNIFSTLDKACKQRAKMSNKFFAFVNRYLTAPFKIGILLNPGFLLGNMNDAYLKQASTMAKKYGTSVPEELANVASSIRSTIYLNNRFKDVYDKYIDEIENVYKLEMNPADKLYSQVAKSKPTRDGFLNYLDGTYEYEIAPGQKDFITPNLTDDEKGIAKVWIHLNAVQPTEGITKELLKDADGINYAKNPIDRILYGLRNYDNKSPKTWGLFNNPLSKSVFGASEVTESVARSASILNDLKHQGIELDEFAKLLGETDKTEFHVKMLDAINAMHNANFDYNATSPILEGIEGFVPFPTFWLKNVSYWFDMFMNHPQYIDHALTVNEGMWANEDVTNDEFKADAKARGAVPMSAFVDNKGEHKLSNFFKGIYKPSPLQSMFTAFNTMNNPLESTIQRSHPLIQGAGVSTERQLNHLNLTTNLFDPETVRYRPYNTDQYQPNININEDDFSAIKYTAHKLNPFDRALNTGLRTPGKVRRGEAQLSDFLPSVFQPDFSKK